MYLKEKRDFIKSVEVEDWSSFEVLQNAFHGKDELISYYQTLCSLFLAVNLMAKLLQYHCSYVIASNALKPNLKSTFCSEAETTLAVKMRLTASKSALTKLKDFLSRGYLVVKFTTTRDHTLPQITTYDFSL